MFEKGMAALWPEILDKETAHKAAMFGVWASVFTGGATLLSVATDLTNYLPLVDVFIVIVIGFFIYKNSRTAATIGLIFCLCQIVYKFEARGTVGILPIILLYYVNGARGCYAHHKYQKDSKPVANLTKDLN